MKKLFIRLLSVRVGQRKSCLHQSSHSWLFSYTLLYLWLFTCSRFCIHWHQCKQQPSKLETLATQRKWSYTGNIPTMEWCFIWQGRAKQPIVLWFKEWNCQCFTSCWLANKQDVQSFSNYDYLSPMAGLQELQSVLFQSLSFLLLRKWCQVPPSPLCS